MNIYTNEGRRSRRDVDVYLEPNRALRIDLVGSGSLTEEMLGDWNHGRIQTIHDPTKLIPLLLRKRFAGRTLDFSEVEELVREAGCETSFWAG